ncbi:enoyl-CoA hydratase [Reyranella sp. CPCC 100927]|uniref:enoyl-CoA hydratase n=1 Tax=Reyranella sp. CPCC 100927 TaxID=2599616 RepID=UPI0011B4C3C8|nr:enoyl-CoA hydratase [Reyranella sp. CPCC 100927]TWT05026.1 enoyl-CoA hydratase [Reyranella sp. CPCC 100927]
MTEQTVQYAVADGIATVTLNRPDKLNAWTRQMQGEVKDAMLRAAADAAVRAIILTGAGRGFCAGADMEVLTAASSGAGAAVSGAVPRPAVDPTASVNARADFRMTHSYFPAIPKPIVAAVNGPCAGLGFVIALYCDMRFAGESAMFTTSFAQRGLIAEHGLSWLLPKLVGLPHAADLLYSARKVRAPEALQLGLVQRLFPDQDLMAQTRAYLKTIVEDVSPRSVAVMKRQIWEAQFQTLSEATVIANHEMEQSFSTADFKEGVAHFLEKRKARFTGR